VVYRQITHNWEEWGLNSIYEDRFSWAINLEQGIDYKIEEDSNLALLNVL